MSGGTIPLLVKLVCLSWCFVLVVVLCAFVVTYRVDGFVWCRVGASTVNGAMRCGGLFLVSHGVAAAVMSTPVLIAAYQAL